MLRTCILDPTTIQNTEIENSIVMSGARIDCGKRVTDSLIGRNVKILRSIKKMLEAPRGWENHYGDGKAAKKIVEITQLWCY